MSVSTAIARRNLIVISSHPLFLLPAILAPLVFFASFSGGFSGLSSVPEFDYSPGYTTFQFVFVLLQSSIFNGVVSAIGIGRDFETGFMKRLMLASPGREGIVVGYVLAALTRATASVMVLSVAGAIAGVRFQGGPAQIVAAIALLATIVIMGTLFGASVSFKLKTVQAAPLVQIPTFLLLFLAPTFVPYELLSGWIKRAAAGNPVTPLLTTQRALVAGEPANLALPFAIAIFIVAALAILASRNAVAAEG